MRTGKAIALTPRDLEIFRSLIHYRYLRSTYLHAFAGGASPTRFKERLGDLFHEGFLERPGQQWQFAHARYRPALYEIGDGARRALHAHGVTETGARTFLRGTVHRQFAHSVMICECLASIELAARQSIGLRFISWPEIVARAPAMTRAAPIPFRIELSSRALIPDAIFGLEYAQGDKRVYRFFALEADRATMPVSRSSTGQTSYLGKLADYSEITRRELHKSWWRIPNLIVLTVTTSEPRMHEIRRRLTTNADGNSAFLFKTVAEEGCPLKDPVQSLLCEPWTRAGDLPPLRIDESG
ncbi:MAG TPA: replication-relaxation family protein [Rhizomicrobium sp.]|jgi:hypothetical protein|nr:replication-relaxation family protein [Rhizomicrobium sp.]